jgi:hypothetical protein
MELRDVYETCTPSDDLEFCCGITGVQTLSHSRRETSVNACALSVGSSGTENPRLTFHNSNSCVWSQTYRSSVTLQWATVTVELVDDANSNRN